MINPTNERRRFSNVLIVEDDANHRATLSDILQHEGFGTTTAVDAHEAIDIVKREEFGVAILDFRLPDLNGTVLLEQIRKMNEQIRVIIHTGFASFDSAKDAINHGAFAYVEKAGNPEELLRHVHRAIQSHYDRYAGDLEAAVAERTASLSESEERYRSLVELSPNGIALHGDAGFAYLNQSAVTIFGAQDVQSLIGRRLWEFVREDQRSYVEQCLAQILKNRMPSDFGEICLMIIGNGERRVEIRGVHVVLSGKSVVQLLLRDVTELRLAEEERKLFEARIHETQKMETAGQLAAGIAHDFNNLLTVILGSSDLLREKLRADPHLGNDVRTFIDQIDSAGQRASMLTSRLLTFSRRQPVSLRVIDLNRVILDIERLLRGVLGEPIRFEIHESAETSPIRADVSQIEQVLMNLAINARDAMPNGGTFQLSIDRFVPDRRFRAAHPDLPQSEFVRLRAADTGMGMSPETLNRIFEPFFTTKPTGKGTGLGLPTVYGIVRQAGGEIEVQSIPDSGTEFTIYWPMADQSPSTVNAADEGDTPEFKGTILLCEDDETVRQVAADMLISAGHRVLVASTPAEAIDLADRYGSEIDVLLSDIMMHQMRGDELAGLLKARFTNLGVILMTGCATDEPRHRGEVAPGYRVLSKPFTREQILRLINSTIQSIRPRRPDWAAQQF
ncbi:MAG: response regulator [Phycisphaerae bacterium]|nr:response regulator [Phycisphaerae bacterium]